MYELYGLRPNNLPELENIKHNLEKFYKILETIAKSYTLVAPKDWLEAIQTNWDRYKIRLRF